MRQLATILLKKVVLNSPVTAIWKTLEKPTQTALKEQILNLLLQQQERTTLLQIADLVSSLASSVFAHEKEWNDLLLLLKNWTASQNEIQREASITILSDILCCSELKSFHKELAAIFTNAVSDPTVPVRIAALYAITQLVAVSPNTSLDFSVICPKIFEVSLPSPFPFLIPFFLSLFLSLLLFPSPLSLFPSLIPLSPYSFPYSPPLISLFPPFHFSSRLTSFPSSLSHHSSITFLSSFFTLYIPPSLAILLIPCLLSTYPPLYLPTIPLHPKSYLPSSYPSNSACLPLFRRMEFFLSSFPNSILILQQIIL